VLEIGAGTGRVTAALAVVAERVTAVDSAAPLLRLAAARLTGVRNVDLLCADARALPLAGRFGVVVAAYRVVQHLHAPAERRALFRAVALLLEPGGRLAFDTWHGPAGGSRRDREPLLVSLMERAVRAELGSAGLAVRSVAGGFQGEPADAEQFTRVWVAAPTVGEGSS
jgi:SAM-dependent methyltransferase